MDTYRVWDCEYEVVVEADDLWSAIDIAMTTLKFAPIGAERTNQDGND